MASSYEDTDVRHATHVRLKGSVNSSIGGIEAGAFGQLMVLHNLSGAYFTINHEDTSSAAANRFSLPGAVDLGLNDTQKVLFVYSKYDSRWHQVADPA